MATKEIRNLKLEREHLRVRHAAAASGTFIVRQLSDALDTAVIGLWERLVTDDSCALIATRSTVAAVTISRRKCIGVRMVARFDSRGYLSQYVNKWLGSC